MEGFPYSEPEAWAIVTRLPARPLYTHRVVWNRTGGKVARQRMGWISKVRREPNGCWSWVGPDIPRPGRAPILAYYVRSHEGHTGAAKGPSAYWWMIREWFPEFEPSLHRTYQTCGNIRCVSPIHRQHGTSRQFTKLTDEQVMAIYRQRYDRSMTSLANEFGVSRTLVRRIWIGDHRSNVTGHNRSVAP